MHFLSEKEKGFVKNVLWMEHEEEREKKSLKFYDDSYGFIVKCGDKREGKSTERQNGKLHNYE